MVNSQLHILHIIRHFYAGGCERLFSDILRHSDRTAYRHSVISLHNATALSDTYERASLVEQTLNIPYHIATDPQQLLTLVRTLQPDIIKTWLPRSNITGGLMGRMLNIPVIWGIHSAMSPDQFPSERTVFEEQLRLSHTVPKRIVCCSAPVYNLCTQMGFNPELLTTIINGTDTEIFTFQPEGRKRIRDSLNIDDTSPLIGMAANHVPVVKGHEKFLYAAKLLLASTPNAHFLFCGKEVDASNVPLTSTISRLDLKQRVHLLGSRDDMADIYSALDIHTLNSKSESFGLATTEAMACETLCVATDVGISKTLLENVGTLIPAAHEASELAAAWQSFLALSPEKKRHCQKTGRERIRQHYSIVKTAQQYDLLYKNTA